MAEAQEPEICKTQTITASSFSRLSLLQRPWAPFAAPGSCVARAPCCRAAEPPAELSSLSSFTAAPSRGPQTHFMLLGPARPIHTLLRATPLLQPATGSATAQKVSLHSYTQNQSFLARVCGVIVGSAPQERAGEFGREVSLSPPSRPPHTAGLQPAALLSQHERCRKVLFYPPKILSFVCSR